MTTDKRDEKKHEKKADTPVTAEKHQRENPNTAKADLDPKDREKDYSKDRQVTTGAKTEAQAKLEDDLWQEQSLSPSNGAKTREQIEADHPGLGGNSPASEVSTVDPYVQAQQDLINERAEQNRVAQEEKAIEDADDDGATERRIKAERETEEASLAKQKNTLGKASDDDNLNQTNKSKEQIEADKKAEKESEKKDTKNQKK